VEPAFIEICDADANAIGVRAGDGVEVNENLATLEVRINDSLAPGCAGFSSGLAGTENLPSVQFASLKKASQWQRRTPEVIGSDGGGHV
jgi:hypothetical protein